PPAMQGRRRHAQVPRQIPQQPFPLPQSPSHLISFLRGSFLAEPSQEAPHHPAAETLGTFGGMKPLDVEAVGHLAQRPTLPPHRPRPSRALPPRPRPGALPVAAPRRLPPPPSQPAPAPPHGPPPPPRLPPRPRPAPLVHHTPHTWPIPRPRRFRPP